MKRAILLLFLPLIALADPGSGTRYLMNEPASLMDLGLLKANLGFEEWRASYRRQVRREFGDSANGALTYATYNYEKDLIIVKISLLTSAKEITPTECEFAIEKHWGVIRARIESWFFYSEDRKAYRTRTTDQPDGMRELILDRVELLCIAGLRTARSRISNGEIIWSNWEKGDD